MIKIVEWLIDLLCKVFGVEASTTAFVKIGNESVVISTRTIGTKTIVYLNDKRVDGLIQGIEDELKGIDLTLEESSVLSEVQKYKFIVTNMMLKIFNLEQGLRDKTRVKVERKRKLDRRNKA